MGDNRESTAWQIDPFRGPMYVSETNKEERQVAKPTDQNTVHDVKNGMPPAAKVGAGATGRGGLGGKKGTGAGATGRGGLGGKKGTGGMSTKTGPLGTDGGRGGKKGTGGMSTKTGPLGTDGGRGGKKGTGELGANIGRPGADPDTVDGIPEGGGFPQGDFAGLGPMCTAAAGLWRSSCPQAGKGDDDGEGNNGGVDADGNDHMGRQADTVRAGDASAGGAPAHPRE